MNTEILNTLYTQFRRNTTISHAELFAYIKSKFPNLAEKTISWKINQLKSKGIIIHVSRGIYSLKKKNDYIPIISPHMKRIFNKIKTKLPYLDLCIWDSRWFNDFTIHQLFRFFIVVETEKDAIESVFNTLTEFNKNVFLDPDKEIYKLYILNNNEAIIVKPLISQAPLREINKITIPTLEKLLVDCLIDTDLFGAQQSELEYIYQEAFQRYTINLNKIKRYARRRNQLTELENRIVEQNLMTL